MAGTGDPSEDVAEVQLVDAANVAEKWQAVGTSLDEKGHTVAGFKSKSKGKFPSEIDAAMTAIAQAYCSVGARWTNAAGDVMRQHSDVDVPKAADYKTRTEEVQQAKKSLAQGLMIAVMGGSPAYAESAKASLAAKRAARLKTLDTALADTNGRVQSLPGHGQGAKAEAEKARAAMVHSFGGGQAMPDSVQQIVPPSSAPTANKNGGPNAKPSNTPSSPSKPSGEKPTDEKNQTATPTDTKAQTPQSGLPQSPAQQQGQGQQPQGGAAQPGGAAPTGAGAQRAPGALPVSQPTPVRDNIGKGSGPSVRPTPSSPVQTPAQRAGLGGGGKNGGALGSGTAATGAGGAASPTANKSGGAGTGAGGSSAASTGAGRPMMGGMMGGGHGAGAGGATARPKAEVKTTDKRMSAEDIAEQALGGVVKDGDDGRPVLPAAPGSNGKATVPTPPVKP
ncbi:hypothetical protein ACXYTP_21670 [Tsukamurella ocularis]